MSVVTFGGLNLKSTFGGFRISLQIAALSRAHVRRPYVCSKCEERFHRRDALVTHVNRMHPGSEQPPSGLTHMAGAEQKQEDVAPADANAGATGLEQSTKQSGAGGGAGGARSGYKCKLCQSELVDRDTFREHMLAAHDKPDLVF